jgi:uncharacterized protein YciI
VKYFFFKLIPPRPTFAQDMTDAEAAIMREHAAYWKNWMDRGRVVAFGPVADPKGGYGMGIVQLEDDSEIDSLRLNDPTIKANRGFRFEISPILRLVTPE